ncbi:MAG: MFS transporter [Actinobacteria bacterium]|jgi:MFS family permease|nr:MFS transporter [Actinomycetota bacterium]
MGIWPVGKGSRLNRILTIRWSGQITDGLFQSALASFVLFSPERAPDAISAALAFAVVLLPYSLIGPYIGTFLDRFSRQRIIRNCNYLRAANLLIVAYLVNIGATGIILTFFVLLAFGVNRLILAGLSAGLPLLVKKEELIAANALAVTGGTIWVVIGGGIGIAAKNIVSKNYGSDFADSVVILLATLGFTFAALACYRLEKMEIGPLPHEQPYENQGFKEILEGLKILKAHPDTLRGIASVAMQRGGITALTLMALLLERNTFNNPQDPDAGLAGFGVALAIAGIGIGIGAIISPYGVLKFGRHRWMKLLMFGCIPPLLIYAYQVSEITMIGSAFLVGLCGQGIKVTNDALVQSKIKDEYRGRVFAFYDVAVNAGIVTGAIGAALLLPDSGVTSILPAVIATFYLFAALVLMRKSKFSAAATN